MNSEVIATSGTQKNEQINLSFQKSVFSLDTLKRAALKFSADCSFEFRIKNEETLLGVSFRVPLPEERQRQLIDDFKIEVLDQDLRASIAAETEMYRNLILANVFSKTSFSNLPEE